MKIHVNKKKMMNICLELEFPVLTISRATRSSDKIIIKSSSFFFCIKERDRVLVSFVSSGFFYLKKEKHFCTWRYDTWRCADASGQQVPLFLFDFQCVWGV